MLNVFFDPVSSKDNEYVENIIRALENNGVNIVNRSATDKIGKILSILKLIFLKRRIIHFNWIENGLYKNHIKTKIYCFFLDMLHIIGIKFVWTMHNTVPHSCKNSQDVKLAKAFFKKWISKMDLIVIHSRNTEKILFDEYKIAEDKVFYIPHGAYVKREVQNVDIQQAKINYQIELNNIVFLFLGVIDTYKNIPLLLKSFAASNIPNAKLLICGKYGANISDKDKEFIQQYKNNPNIVIIDRFIQDVEIPVLFNIADVVVLPYDKTSMQNSGAAILAFSYYKPVIIPRFGFIEDIEEKKWVYSYDYATKEDHEKVLSEILGEFCRRYREIDDVLKTNEEKDFVEKFLNWDRICEKLCKKYSEIMDE